MVQRPVEFLPEDHRARYPLRGGTDKPGLPPEASGTDGISRSPLTPYACTCTSDTL